MEQEITVQVLCSFREALETLRKNGYVPLCEVAICDSFWTREPNHKNMPYQQIINDSKILREMVIKDSKGCKEVKLLTQKTKQFNEHGKVIGEDKTDTKVDDIPTEKEKLRTDGYYNFLNKTQTRFPMKGPDGFVLFIQDINGAGVFLELEQKTTAPGGGRVLAEMQGTPQEIFKTLVNKAVATGLPLGNDFAVQPTEILMQRNANAKEKE